MPNRAAKVSSMLGENEQVVNDFDCLNNRGGLGVKYRVFEDLCLKNDQLLPNTVHRYVCYSISRNKLSEMLFSKVFQFQGVPQSISNMMTKAKSACFLLKKTPKTIVLDEVDLVFLVDSTGGMADGGALDQVCVL